LLSRWVDTWGEVEAVLCLKRGPKLPGEVQVEISPMAAQISALKNDLRGSIEARRTEVHDSTMWAEQLKEGIVD
jgi:hypothetical protein